MTYKADVYIFFLKENYNPQWKYFSYETLDVK